MRKAVLLLRLWEMARLGTVVMGGAALAAELTTPLGVATDLNGNVYIADWSNNCVRKVNKFGIISTFAGTGISGFSGDGGAATAATLNAPADLASDRIGNVYITDRGNLCIRKVNTSGIISTIAGTGYTGYGGDGGPASLAILYFAEGLATDTSGNLFIADKYNNRIRMVNTSGIISTIAGNGIGGYGGDGGAATAAQLNKPYSLVVDAGGNIYINDCSNSCIRKVNSTGIISTIAGNGTLGYSGDYGPATQAELNQPWGIAVDASGNLYIADNMNYRIRKVTSSGIINTIAGTGISGFSGDGGSAIAAELGSPGGICIDSSQNLYIADGGNHRMRKISYTPNFVSDSFSVYLSDLCNGVQFDIETNSCTAGQHIITYFGTGKRLDTATTASFGQGISSFFQTFSTGTYTIKHILYDGAIAIDSLTYSKAFSECQNFTIEYYYDANTDCVFDSGDNAISLPVLTEVDSNGVAIDTISSISGLYYTAYGNPGDVYSFKIISSPGYLTTSCPISGIITDTIQTTSGAIPTQTIGFRCAPGTSYDYSVNPFVFWTGPRDQYGHVYLSNSTCYSPGSTLTVQFSHKCVFTAGTYTAYTTPTPTSYTDSTITWNFPGPTAIVAPIDVHYLIWANPTIGDLTIGDTIHTQFTISPTAGDLDSANNVEMVIDTVKAGCDPNEMSVYPQGIIPPTATQLKYTINFENTGNDTAFNIYVMDTLSDNVDISTFRMVLASAQMNISKYKSGGHNIIKFDFPGINLLDSAASPSKCTGAVIFNLNTIGGLAVGTTIFNHAGIFFDDNPVVMTDTVEDIVGWNVGVPQINKNTLVNIYPNPAHDAITIKTEANVYSSYTITDAIGTMVLQGSINATQTQVDLKTLSVGVYFVTLTSGDGERVIRQVVKE